MGSRSSLLVRVRIHGGPQEAHELAPHRHDDLVVRLAAGPQALNVFSPDFVDCFAALSGSALPPLELEPPLLGDRVVELLKSYRFTADSEVGRLAALLLEQGRLPRAGEGELAMTTLAQDWQSVLRGTVEAFRAAVQRGAHLRRPHGAPVR